jgi:TolB protein
MKQLFQFVFLLVLIALSYACSPVQSEGEVTPTLTPALPTNTLTPKGPLTGDGGGIVAFVSDRLGRIGEIFMMNADGSDLRQITRDKDFIVAPAFSPSGDRIAYVSGREGGPEIYIVNVNEALESIAGIKGTRLTNNPTSKQHLTWSPDGLHIAYSGQMGDVNGIWVVGSGGGTPELLWQSTNKIGEIDWSPDGLQIALSSKIGNKWIAQILTITTGEIRSLTDNLVNTYAPRWSPDGKKILYYSSEGGDYELWVMTVDGSERVQLTNNDINDWWADWSPDGDKIVFCTMIGSEYLHEIQIINTDGSNQRRLTTHAADDWWPTFSPVPVSE